MSTDSDGALFEIIEDALADRYRILAYTGGKGMSSLYEAEDVTLRRKVRIKCVFFDASAGPEVLETQKTRFYREAEVTAQLTHRAIVPIFDVTTKPASAFIVMAYIDGDSLQDLLRPGVHFGLSECVDLFADVASGLDYIHAQGVIHRNVKPANIIIRHPSGAALSDFSLAQTRTSSKFTLPAKVAGTPTFMSPEQARGEAVDARSDLFSFGAILFLCLSGFKPFVGKNPRETMALVAGPDPPRPVDWEKLGEPAALDGFFRKALAKDAQERFGSGAELIDSLSALAADSETASATAVSVPPAPQTSEPLDPEQLKMMREEERALELSPTISDVLQVVPLTSEEGFVLSRIDGTSKPRDIVAVSPLDEENTTRVLLGMLDKELVSFRDAEAPIATRKDHPPDIQEDADFTVSSDPESAPSPSKTAVADEADSFDKEKHARGLFRHAEQAYELQDHWQTIQLCRQAIELYDQEAKIHHLLAIALVRNKKWRKEAAVSLKRAVDLDEKNLDYLGLLAVLYQSEGLQLRADKIIDQVTKIDPSFELPQLPA